jgi:hypothetical protein
MKGMMGFHTLFPEIGVDETKSATLPGGSYGLPPDSYGFLEFYCIDPDCKCRRVLINVISERQRAHLATINHAFEPPAPRSFTPDQTFLDPINPQSDFSKALLLLFTEVLLRDYAYARRLMHHYQMVKDALSDPSHTIHAIVASGINESAVRASSQSSIDPYESCPCGSGKKFKWCCREKIRKARSWRDNRIS